MNPFRLIPLKTLHRMHDWLDDAQQHIVDAGETVFDKAAGLLDYPMDWIHGAIWSA